MPSLFDIGKSGLQAYRQSLAVTGQNIAVDGGHTLRRAPDLEPAIRARMGNEEYSKLSKPGSGPNG